VDGDLKGGEALHQKVSDPIVELVEPWHGGENEGDEPTDIADIIVFYAGVKGMPITFRKEV